MRLRDWLKERDITEVEFAARLNIDRTALNRWKNGERRPSAKFMIVVAKATRGAVMPNDWFDIPQPRQPKARKPSRKPRVRDGAAAQ